MFGRKVAKLMEWVAMVGCPIIGINDSAGARIQDTATSLAWYAELGRRHEMLRGLVPPEISLIFGKCAGGAVYSPIQTDLVVAVRDQATCSSPDRMSSRTSPVKTSASTSWAAPMCRRSAATSTRWSSRRPRRTSTSATT